MASLLSNLFKMPTGRPITERLQQMRNVDYNVRRKERALSQRQEEATSPVPEVAYDLQTPEGQIAYFKEQIARARQPLQKAREDIHKATTRRSLRNVFTPRKTRIGLKKQRADIETSLEDLGTKDKAVDEVKEFTETVDYGNYDQKYAQLSPLAKSMVSTPEDVKSTESYRQWADYQEQLADYNAYQRAVKMYEKGLGWAAGFLSSSGEEGRIKKYLREFNKMERLQKEQYNKQIKQFTDQGLVPIIDKGKIIGFSDTLNKQSIPLPTINITEIPPQTLEGNMSKVLVNEPKMSYNLTGMSVLPFSLNKNIGDYQFVKQTSLGKQYFDNRTGVRIIVGKDGKIVRSNAPENNLVYSVIPPNQSTEKIYLDLYKGDPRRNLNVNLSYDGLPLGLNTNLSSKIDGSQLNSLLANNASSRVTGTVDTSVIDRLRIISGGKIDLAKGKENIQKAWQELKTIPKNIWEFVGPERTGNLYVNVRPNLMNLGSFGGISPLPGPGRVSITDIKKQISIEQQKSLSGQLNNSITDLEKSIKNLDKWNNKIQNDTFVGNAAEYIRYQQDFSKYQNKLDDYEKINSKIQNLGYGDVLKEGAKGIVFRGISKLPESPGQLAVAAGATYGAWRLLGPTALRLFGKLEAAPLGKLGLAGLDIYFGTKGVQAFTSPELLPEERVAGLGVAGLSGYSVLRTGADLVASVPSGTGRISSLTTEAENLPYIRKRATVLIEDNQGRVLYHTDKNTGLAILPGGKIEAGESALKAAQRELFEETGLKLSLKAFDKVITEREAHYIYKAKVNNLDELIPKLTAQAKEVTGFRAIDPRTYTGKTQLSVFGSRGVRAEDLYIGSRAKAMNEINTFISRLNPSQKTALIEQAKAEMTRVYGSKALQLTKDNLLREWLLLRKGMQYRRLYIRPAETFRRRGQPVFLRQRVQKPSLKKPSSIVDFLTGRKPGQFKAFQKEPPIVVGFGSRYDVPFKRLKEYGKDLNTYLHGTPDSIPTELEVYGEYNLVDNMISPKAAEKFKVQASKVKRGEDVLYFQPATTPGGEEAYVGASYLGLLRKAPSTEEIKIGFGRGSPTIYRFKGRAGKDLVYTEKARFGVEFEVGAPPGKVFVTRGKPDVVNLGGRRVKIQDIELENAAGLTESQIREGLTNLNRMNPSQKKSFLSRVKRETGRDYYYLSRGYVVDPLQALNKALAPARGSGRRVPSERPNQKRFDRSSEELRFSSDLNDLMIGPSKMRYRGTRERPGPSKVTPSKERYKFDEYLVPKRRYGPEKYVYAPERVPYKPKQPYKYKAPPYQPPLIRVPPRSPARVVRGGAGRPKLGLGRERRRKMKYETLPTVAELLIVPRAKLRREKPKVKITGFEAFRFI